MDLVTMRTRVREDLQDTDAANYRWTNDEIEGAIERVLWEYSLKAPIEEQDDLATTADSQEITITSLSDLLSIESVEFPIGYSPKCFQRFELYASRLFMDDEGNGDDVRVRWLKKHTIYSTIWVANTAYVLGDIVVPTSGKENGYSYICTTAGTSHAATEPTWPTTIGGTVSDGTAVWTCQNGCTIPTEHEEIIILGATGYLAMSASAYAVDKASIGGRYATYNFRQWGQTRLDRYERKLKQASRSNKVISKELYTE